MKATDTEIISLYQGMLNSGKWNPSNIIKYFKGADYIRGGEHMSGTGVRSPYGMRKKEALEIMRNLKKVQPSIDAFIARNKKSDMCAATQEKMRRVALKVGGKDALASSERGSKKGVVSESVEDLQARTYNKVDASSDYVEFYG